MDLKVIGRLKYAIKKVELLFLWIFFLKKKLKKEEGIFLSQINNFFKIITECFQQVLSSYFIKTEKKKVFGKILYFPNFLKPAFRQHSQYGKEKKRKEKAAYHEGVYKYKHTLQASSNSPHKIFFFFFFSCLILFNFVFFQIFPTLFYIQTPLGPKSITKRPFSFQLCKV